MSRPMHTGPFANEGPPLRRGELKDLYRWACASGTDAAESMTLTGDRGMGKTSLLQQLAAQLFWKQERVAPFLYTATEALRDVSDFARDYLAAYVRQRLAFDLRDHALLSGAGVPLRELAARAGAQGAVWARELIERFDHAADDPLAQLQTALQAPDRSVRQTGRPVVVLLDRFPVLAGLRRAGAEESSLLALFHGPITARSTPHLLAGTGAAVRELLLPPLTEYSIRPLTAGDAARYLEQVLHAAGGATVAAPAALVDHLNGNPLYLFRLARAVVRRVASGDEAFWSAYGDEIAAGGLHHYLTAPLRTEIIAADERRRSVEVLHRVYTAGTDPTTGRLAPVFVEERLTPATIRTLLHAGLLVGDFGGYRAPEDAVLHDLVTLLYERDIVGRSQDEVRGRICAERAAPPAPAVWNLTVPLAPRSELVVAECLEQVGKNLHCSEDSISQLQLAVIEACINAIEHTRSSDGRLLITIRALSGKLEVAVESHGQGFGLDELGGPIVDNLERGGPPRGQGIRLMRRFSDDVRFEQTARGTRVILVKNISRSTASIKEGTSRHE